MAKVNGVVESFVRAYAKQRVESITVDADDHETIKISFAARTVTVPIGKIVMRDDAFRLLGEAIDDLLGLEGDAMSAEERVAS